MLFGVEVNHLWIAALGTAIGVVVGAIAGGWVKIKRQVTKSKVEESEAENKKAEVDIKIDDKSFNEAQKMLRIATARIDKLENERDERGRNHAREIECLRKDVEDCRTERAAMRVEIEWLKSDRDEARTKSGEHTRPKEMP